MRLRIGCVLILLLSAGCRQASVSPENPDGPVVHKNAAGELQYSREWRHGRPHGLWREYRGGRLVSEASFEDGKKIGEWRTWYNSGQIKSQGFYVNGVEQGPWLAWHENGKPSFETHYFQGKPFGLMRSWSSEGRLLHRDYFP